MAYLSPTHPTPRAMPQSPSLLLVEDDPSLSQQLAALLNKKGYNVTLITCGREAADAIDCNQYDLILLDVNLPHIDGFKLLSYVRQKQDTPVIMLTAYGAEEYRIQGLKYGADDYISKPCNFTEVQLRIESILRRTNQASNNRARTELHCDHISLFRKSHSVKLTFESHSSQFDLTPAQFNLLWVLVDNQGQVQDKTFLYQTVLAKQYSQYDRSLDMHLSRVRRRLVEAGMAPDRIRTVHGKGYLFQ